MVVKVHGHNNEGRQVNVTTLLDTDWEEVGQYIAFIVCQGATLTGLIVEGD